MAIEHFFEQLGFDAVEQARVQHEVPVGVGHRAPHARVEPCPPEVARGYCTRPAELPFAAYT